MQPRPKAFPLNLGWAGNSREKPWGRGCVAWFVTFAFYYLSKRIKKDWMTSRVHNTLSSRALKTCGIFAWIKTTNTLRVHIQVQVIT